jgi:Phosphohistidine phosphatase SixA
VILESITNFLFLKKFVNQNFDKYFIFYYYKINGSSMDFYLIRHGIAEDSSLNDLERKLTLEGQKKVKKVASICSKIFSKPDTILTSEALRSVETAEIFAKKWKVKKIDSYSKLNPGASVYDYLFILGAYLNKDIINSNYKIAIITHEPDLSHFALSLLSNQIRYDFRLEELIYKESILNFNLKLKKSSLMVIKWDGEESELIFYSTPSIFAKINKL